MKIILSITKIFGFIAMGVLLLMMLLTVTDVFLRAALNKPIIGTTEITEQMMVAVVFLGLGWCAIQGRHIKVDLFVSHYPKPTQKIIDITIQTIGLIFVAFLCWRTFKTTLMVKTLGITCSYIGVPKYPFYAIATVGWFILALSIVSLLIKNLRDGLNR